MPQKCRQFRAPAEPTAACLHVSNRCRDIGLAFHLWEQIAVQ